MKDSLPARICRYIDIENVDNYSDFKWYCQTFKPAWYGELLINGEFYLKYINNRILRKAGIK